MKEYKRLNQVGDKLMVREVRGGTVTALPNDFKNRKVYAVRIEEIMQGSLNSFIFKNQDETMDILVIEYNSYEHYYKFNNHLKNYTYLQVIKYLS